MSDCKQKYIEWSSENAGWYCGEYEGELCGVEARTEFGGWEACWNQQQAVIDQRNKRIIELSAELEKAQNRLRRLNDE